MDILTYIMPVVMLLLGFFIGISFSGYIKQKPVKKEQSEQEIREQERINKHFQQLMQYDVTKATRRRSLI